MIGGLSLGKDVPICKHLLACVLAERGGSISHVIGIGRTFSSSMPNQLHDINYHIAMANAMEASITKKAIEIENLKKQVAKLQVSIQQKGCHP